MGKPLAIIFHVCLLLGFHSLLAQYPYPEQELAEQVPNRILAVQLLYEDSDVEIALNTILKEAFLENYSEKIEFFYPPEIEKLKRKEREKYTFLTQPEFLPDDLRLGIDYVDDSYHQWIVGGSTGPTQRSKEEIENFSYQTITLDYYQFLLTTFDGKKEKLITTITFPNGNLGKHDYLFLVQQINILTSSSIEGVMRADFMDVEDNIEQIKSLTCYFLQDYFGEEIIHNFSKYYEYPFEVVPFPRYQKTILNRLLNIAYIRIIFSFQHNRYMWVVVNALDGRVLAINDIGDYKFKGDYDAKDLIKPRYLRKSLNIDTQMLNNYYNK